MKTKLTNRPIDQVIAAIHSLDLDPIRDRVMDPELGEGWSREHAESVERGYRKYLTMLVKHPDDIEDIVVSTDVDEFWHTHILYTMKYMEDCESVFGHYLHHNPHIGKRTQADVERKAAQAEKTERLRQNDCGASRTGNRVWRAASAKPAWCGAAIKSEGAAWCGAAVRSENLAWCGASVQAEGAAWRGASAKPAWCGAAVKSEGAAWCGAAVRP